MISTTAISLNRLNVNVLMSNIAFSDLCDFYYQTLLTNSVCMQTVKITPAKLVKLILLYIIS